jgi:hypothetical protein
VSARSNLEAARRRGHLFLRDWEGGQGRPQAARRGSLDGPVIHQRHNGIRNPGGFLISLVRRACWPTWPCSLRHMSLDSLEPWGV